MQLVAVIDQLHQARIYGFVAIPPDYFHNPVTFLIDTGASATCLLPDDVRRLRIDHSKLASGKKAIVTATGPVDLKTLPEAIVSLPCRTGLLNRPGKMSIPFENLPIIPPTPSQRALPDELVFSIIGMDILSNFPRWKFNKNELTMETEIEDFRSLKMSFRL